MRFVKNDRGVRVGRIGRAVSGEYLVPFSKIAALLLVAVFVPSGHIVAYFVCIVWALRGENHAVEALTGAWILAYTNPGIVQIAESASSLRWLVVIASSAGVLHSLIRTRERLLPVWSMWLAGFVIFALLTALCYAYAADVAITKIVSFMLVAWVSIAAYKRDEESYARVRAWFICLSAVVLIGGLPLLGMSVGYLRNERGFQGLLSHPQTLGVFCGMTVPWLFLMFLERRRGWQLCALSALAGVVSLYLSQCRTGMLAFSLAMLCSLAHVVLYGGRRRVWRTLCNPILLGVISLMMGIAVVKYNAVCESLAESVRKGRDEESASGLLEASRGQFIRSSLENFASSPVYGIGFGLASDPLSLVVTREPYTGFWLPVLAPVEKGFAVAATLEEVGVVGAVLIAGLYFTLIYGTISVRGTSIPVALVAGCTFVNFGESVIYAVGGTGALVWLLIGLSRSAAIFEHTTTGSPNS